MKNCHRERVPGPGPAVFVWVPNELRPRHVSPDGNKEIVRLRHEEGLKLAEIGKRFGIAGQQVYRIAGPRRSHV